jgi:hypothetical protein
MMAVGIPRTERRSVPLRNIRDSLSFEILGFLLLLLHYLYSLTNDIRSERADEAFYI